MKTFLKSNKIKTLFLFAICFILLLNPSVYANSCINGVSVWTFKVFPMLFPFFIFTRLILNLATFNHNPLDKFFLKAYNAPKGSALIFFLSVLSGYPVGAKLIGSMYNLGKINSKQAESMLSFCSVSGPMFMIGTVGTAILGSYMAGIVILVSNVVACLINGFLFRGKPSLNAFQKIDFKKEQNSLSDIVLDSLNSILMVGAYIVFTFLIVEVLNETKILPSLSFAISGVLNIGKYQDVVSSVLSGLFEITGGIVDLSKNNISLKIKSILSSGIIGFGGISVIMQSLSFFQNIKIPTKKIVLQKTCQGIFALIISIPLSILIL